MTYALIVVKERKFGRMHRWTLCIVILNEVKDALIVVKERKYGRMLKSATVHCRTERSERSSNCDEGTKVCEMPKSNQEDIKGWENKSPLIQRQLHSVRFYFQFFTSLYNTV